MRKDRESYVTDENKQCIINWFRKNGYTIEWVDTMNECRVSIEEREQTVFQRLKAFASYDFVITDRLHGMIDDLKVFVKSDFNFEENVCPLALFDDLKGII